MGARTWAWHREPPSPEGDRPQHKGPMLQLMLIAMNGVLRHVGLPWVSATRTPDPAVKPDKERRSHVGSMSAVNGWSEDVVAERPLSSKL